MSSAMRASRCALNAATALRRAFVTSNLSSSISRPLAPALGQAPNSSRSIYVASTAVSTANNPKTLPKDKEILKRFPVVHIVADNGRLSPPTWTSSILHSIDPKTHSLITVALPKPRLRARWDTGSDPYQRNPDAINYQALSSHSITKSKEIPAMERKGFTETELKNAEAAGAYDATREFPDSPTHQLPLLPICKIVPVSHFLPTKYKPIAATGAPPPKKVKKSNPSLTLKTLELNWAIDSHDLEHRLNTMKGFLRKGYRVDVLLVGKRKKRKAEPEEAEKTLRTVKEAVTDVEGAKEWKAMDGNVGGMMRLFIEGKEQEGEQEVEVSGHRMEPKSEVPTTKTGKKLSKNRLKQLGLLGDELSSIDAAAEQMGRP